MDEVSKVSVPLCRYEELLEIETRVQVLIEELEQKEYLSEEDIYLVLGYVKKYKGIKEKKKKESEEFWKKRLESQT